MPKTPIGKIIVGTALIVIGTFTSPYVTLMGVNLILGGVAQQYAQNKAGGAVKEQQDPIKINFDGEESPLFLVFGQIRVGGHLSFMGTYGTNNQYLGIGVTHSVTTKAGCNAITDIFLDENRIDDTIIDGTGEVTSGDYQGLVKIIRYVGDDSSTFDTTIANNISYMANTALGKGLARTHIRLLKGTDDEAFRKAFPRGVPGVSALLQSVCYDPRNDSTNGGTGTERYNDPDTWTFSQNPAVIVGTYLIMAQSDGGWGIDPTSIDWTTLAASANRCDDLVSRPDNSGGSVNAARHTCNVILDTGNTCEENINILLSTMDGSLVTGLDGKVKVLAGEYDVPVTTIDKTWLRDQGATVEYDTDDNNIYNAVRAQYKEPTTGYQTISCVPFTNATYETTDGRREWKELELKATTDRYEAQYLCAIEGRKSRHQKSATLALNYKGFDVEVWENVTLSLSDLGLSGTFKVINWRHEVEGPVITVLEQTSTAWDSAFADYTETIPTPAPALVSETPPTPTGLTAISVADGIQLSWDAVGSGEYSETLIERSTTSGSGFAKIAETRGNTYHDAVTNGSTFYYRIRNRSALKKGVYSAYSSEATNAAKTVQDGATQTGTEGNLIPNALLHTEDNYLFGDWTYAPLSDVPAAERGLISGAGVLKSPSQSAAITLESDAFIPIDPNGYYLAEALVRKWGGAASNFYLGFVPYTADKKRIEAKHFFANAGSYTTLAANASMGATSVIINSATGWGGAGTYIVFNAQSDDSDVPNFEVYEVASRSGTTVNLTTPLAIGYSSGVGVRNHKGSASYMYTMAENQAAPATFTNFHGHIYQTITNFVVAPDGNTFWPGTRFVRLLHLANRDAASATTQAIAEVALRAAMHHNTVASWPNTLFEAGVPAWKIELLTGQAPYLYMGSGHQSVVSLANIGANITGASPLSSSDNGSSAEVSIEAFSIEYADGVVSYGAGQVTGIGFGVFGHVYIDNDPARQGGSVTYSMTTSDGALTRKDGRIWVGDITTATSGSAPTGGSGGAGCVAPEAVLMSGLCASAVKKGDTVLVLDDGGTEVYEGVVYNQPHTLIRPRVQLTTVTGATLVVSVETPVKQPDGQQIMAAHLHGGHIYTEQEDGSWAWENVLDPVYLGDGPVIAFSVNDGSFAAGLPDKTGKVRRMMTHNKPNYG